MRWDDLFADLEGQLAAAESVQFRSDVAEMTRAERATVDLSARIAASKGAEIGLTLVSGEKLSGLVADCAGQWLLIRAGAQQVLVPLAAVAAVQGLAEKAGLVSEVARRLSLGHVLRALARDRAHVMARTLGGDVPGVIRSVGADHLDIAGPVGITTVALSAVMAVRSSELS